MLSTSLVVAGLTTGQKLGLATVGGVFIVFALVSALVLPRRNPNFPGRHVGWFAVVSLLFFVATISAVLVFGKEKEVAQAAETPTTAPATTTSAGSTTPPPAAGDATAGKAVFASAGCAACHTLKDAGSTGTVGPNLDVAQPTYRRATARVTNGKNAMPSFKSQLTTQQIANVAAYVVKATGGTP
jgi:sulfite dehydrogenase